MSVDSRTGTTTTPYVDHDGYWCVPAGMDYAEAITWAMKMAGPPYSHMFVKPAPTGRTVPYRRYIGGDTDWVSAADQLAAAIGQRIVRHRPNGMLQLFDADAHEVAQAMDRSLALRLAWQMGEPNVDAMLKRIPDAQWAEWKLWMMRHPKIGL